MKKMKKVLLILFVCLLSVTLLGCYPTSGGGHFIDQETGNKITFGFFAIPLGGEEAMGEMQIVDHGTKYKLHGTFTGTFEDVDENESVFEGICDPDGILGSGDEVVFNLYVIDGGIGGKDKGDYIEFADSLEHNYSGELKGGNIKIFPTDFINAGFETGDLTGWTILSEADSVSVSGPDAYASPYWGDYMAVLGTPDISSQPFGDNTIMQEFKVTVPELIFAYNVVSQETMSGYDKFEYKIEVLGDSTIIDQFYIDGSSGNTGWHEVEIDLSSYLDEDLELRITAGGTSDLLYPTWAYFDMPWF